MAGNLASVVVGQIGTMHHAATSTTSPSYPPDPLGGSPTSGQSLSRSCHPQDQIHVVLHGSLVLLSEVGGSLGGSLSEWLTLGRSDSLVDGSCESLVDGDESLPEPLVDPLPEPLCE